MIQEDYVSFETAKLLKEKGFDSDEVGCHGGFYSEKCYESGYGVKTNSGQEVGIVYDDLRNCDLDYYEYLRPTLTMAMKWLREVHNIDVDINTYVDIIGIKSYVAYVSTYKSYQLTDADKEFGITEEEVCGRLIQNKRNIRIPDKCELISAHEYFDSYEQACETAIKYCLENLI